MGEAWRGMGEAWRGMGEAWPEMLCCAYYCPTPGESTFVDQLLASLSVGAKRRDVGQLAFNSQGSMLVALSNDMEHTLTIFDWRRGTKVCGISLPTSYRMCSLAI